ncbi:MAG: AlkZ family DNA glycosylase [Solirubrobacterales bacterium]|nr:AlkZ family DNA glycosylase [Solirubrobacterales bacterium]
MDVTSRRLAAQGLSGSNLRDPRAVTGRLLAIQAQDPRGARLAVRARLSESARNPGASAVDRALNDRSLAIGWLNRGTLHLVLAEDYRWLAELTAPRLMTSNQTRLRQEGVSPGDADKGVERICRRLADGPATRAEIKEELESAGVPVAGQALVHILFLACLRNRIMRGPMAGKEQAFVLIEDWLGKPEPVDREAALAELARRYLAGHGPATDRDLAKWAGIPLGQTRQGLEAIASELKEAGDLIELKERSRPGKEEPGARLLGSFDPILHGWESREWIVPDEAQRAVVTTNGIFRPTIFARGEVIGTWKLASGRFELNPFNEPDPGEAKALEREMERVREYLGQ